VPKPFFARRWVQLCVTFLVGLGIFWLGIWVTNGLRADREAKDRDAQTLQQRQALQTWKAEVEAQIGPVAPIQDPIPPAIGADIKTAATAITKGGTPTATKASLAAEAGAITKTADALEAYALADTIRDRGFGVDRVNTITVSRTQIVQALRLYATSASLTAESLGADPAVAKPLARRALDVFASAEALLADGWRAYQLVLGDAGLASAPTLPTG
jgi:hypothetical protein